MDYNKANSPFGYSEAASSIPSSSLNAAQYTDFVAMQSTPTMKYHEWSQASPSSVQPSAQMSEGERISNAAKRGWRESKQSFFHIMNDIRHPSQGLSDLNNWFHARAADPLGGGLLETRLAESALLLDPDTRQTTLTQMGAAVVDGWNEPISLKLEDFLYRATKNGITLGLIAVTGGVAGFAVRALASAAEVGVSLEAEGALASKSSIFRGANTSSKSVRLISSIERVSSNVANAPFISDEAAAAGWKPPYPADLSIRKITASRDIQFVRVHLDPNDALGGFLVREKRIAALNYDTQAVRNYLGLPDALIYITDVNVPAGNRMLIGRIGNQPNFG